MARGFYVDCEVNVNGIVSKLDNLITDEVMLEIHTLFAKLIDPWVPMLEGPLHQSGLAQIYADHVRYGGTDIGVPYALYQYNGTNFNFTKDYHPLASAQWDKVAMQTQMKAFEVGVIKILKRRAREVYG